MPLQATSGAASYDAFGGGVAAVPNYIEDVFSTWLSSTNSFANGINTTQNLGSMIWVKNRTSVEKHYIFTKGAFFADDAYLSSNSTDTATSSGPVPGTPTYSTNGFSLQTVTSSSNYASWTFKKQPKFFDIVTWTGNGSSNRQISHSLGSTPGCIIVKNLDDTTYWCVYHTSLGATKVLYLNYTGGADTSPSVWNNTEPTSTNFTVGNAGNVNGSGLGYVAYLFAHNAGGFGLTGTDNVISCGSFTQGSGNTAVTLGYEPAWVMIKSTDSTGSGWEITDNMRGMPVVGSASAVLAANLSNAESSSTFGVHATATGFVSNGYTSGNFIYIAIRRGPMKVPTDATKVFIPIASSAAAGTVLTTGFPIDMQIGRFRDAVNSDNSTVIDRLRGVSTNSTQSGQKLITSATSAEASTTNKAWQWSNTDFKVATDYGSTSSIYYNFKRAPSFFDEVCYTGTGANTTFSHNLSAIPELMIVKRRNTSGSDWVVYHAFLGNTNRIFLNLNNISETTTSWNNTTPTSSVFSVGTSSFVNGSASTYVAYLFATCAGVSKVGSYTGNGSSQTINCGFTAGARFVLIKKSSGTGDWMVADSARGIVSGNDPYLELNNTNAEVTGEDWLDTDSTGFVVNEVSGSNANTNGATYIFLAIA